MIHRVYCSCKYLEIERISFLNFQYQATGIVLLCKGSITTQKKGVLQGENHISINFCEAVRLGLEQKLLAVETYNISMQTCSTLH